MFCATVVTRRRSPPGVRDIKWGVVSTWALFSVLAVTRTGGVRATTLSVISEFCSVGSVAGVTRPLAALFCVFLVQVAL